MASPISQDVKDKIRTKLQLVLAQLGNENNWKAGYGATAQQVADDTKNVINLGLDQAGALFQGGLAASPFVKLATAASASAEQAGRSVLEKYVGAMTGAGGGFQKALEGSGLSSAVAGPAIESIFDNIIGKTVTQGLPRWNAAIQQSEHREQQQE